MAKKSTIFFCQNCGYESAKWLGQCPACKEWNTLVEETVVTGKAGKSNKKTESLAVRIHEAQPVKLSGIKTESEIRTATGFEELDRVLGGGIVAGSLVLVGGDPGIFCRSAKISQKKAKKYCIYRVKNRFSRLNCERPESEVSERKCCCSVRPALRRSRG